MTVVRLGYHFILDEFEATRVPRIVNHVPYDLLPALSWGVIKILDPLRISLGCPVIIQSGYRCPELNRAVGGVSNSQHMRGEAADIRPGEPEKFDLMVQWLQNCCPFVDQLLTSSQGWAHVSWAPFREPRRQVVLEYYDR